MRTPGSVNGSGSNVRHVARDALDEAGPSDANALAVLLGEQKPVFHRNRQILFREGDISDSIHLVDEGIVKLYRFFSSGKRVITRFVFPGEMIFSPQERVSPVTAEAVGPCTTRRIRKEQLALLSHLAKLDRDLERLLKHDLRQMDQEILPLIHHNAEGRVAMFLMMLSRRNGIPFDDGETLAIPMSRLDIADFLGLTIETVCRTLLKLNETGLIRLTSTNEISVTNSTALAALATAADTHWKVHSEARTPRAQSRQAPLKYWRG